MKNRITFFFYSDLCQALKYCFYNSPLNIFYFTEFLQSQLVYKKTIEDTKTTSFQLFNCSGFKLLMHPVLFMGIANVCYLEISIWHSSCAQTLTHHWWRGHSSLYILPCHLINCSWLNYFFLYFAAFKVCNFLKKSHTQKGKWKEVLDSSHPFSIQRRSSEISECFL